MYCDNKSIYEELLHRTKLPTLYTRRLQAIAMIMYKVKNDLAPSHIAALFVVTSFLHLDFELLVMANIAWPT